MSETKFAKFPGLRKAAQPVKPDPGLYSRIGVRIAQARDGKRLTQEEVGNLIGESSLTISRWENAVRKPNVEDIVKLAQALDQDILFFIEPEPPSDEAFLRLSRAVEGLDEYDREELAAIAEVKLARKKEYAAQRLRDEEK